MPKCFTLWRNVIAWMINNTRMYQTHLRRHLPTPLVLLVLGRFPTVQSPCLYNSPMVEPCSRVYPYPICIRHYARMDRTGNRVPISGNIISVMRLTAARTSTTGRGTRANTTIARPPNVTRKTPGAGRARETREKNEWWPIAVADLPAISESICHFTIDALYTFVSVCYP